MLQNTIPPVKYVILFPGRTGSTYLVSHMQAHPEVCARFEILSRHPGSWENQLQCLRELFETRRRPVIKAAGFKTKISGVENQPAFFDYLHENNFRIIHQYRSNHLKFIISVVRAKMLRNAMGTSNVIKDEHRALGPVEIPLATFARAKKRLNRLVELQAFIDSLQLPIMKLGYEELLSDESTALERVWDFLEVSKFSTHGVVKKNTPVDIREAVTNLDEIIRQYPEMAQYIDQD